ncbi:hypothetical protein DCO58_02190 [Helicobacter saguini]|nr:hypothetical protein [Helicobacter saguini]MWV66517.1 hypothetical protein [Helicobacter saguini]MWV68866.1 hypothetical protein [Helicobacter saguini]
MKENERLQKIKEFEKQRIKDIEKFTENYERLQKEKEYEEFKKRFS